MRFDSNERLVHDSDIAKESERGRGGVEAHEKLYNPLLVEIDGAERLPFWVVGANWSFAVLLCETTADLEDLPRYV